jgi:uncharacterized membrane protein HdeD (DUF308 family)
MLQTLAQNWWAILLRGVCAILFGLGAIPWPGITLAALVLLYGAYALLDGILAVAWSIVGRQAGDFPWGPFVAGLAGIAAGIVTFTWPGLTALILLYLIASWAIVRGVSEVVAAIRLRKELEKSNQAPFCRAVGAAVGVAEPTRYRRHIDDDAGVGLLQMRDGETRYIECAGQVDLQDLFPGVRVHLCDRRGRACNTGIVHQHIEPTERIDGVRDHAFDVLTAAMMLHVFVTGA